MRPFRLPATLLLLFLVGCGASEAERTQAAVLRVLRADQELGVQRDALPPDATPSQLAWSIGKYCDALERLDMSDCPADFRLAYRHHIRAWREAEQALKQLPNGFLEGVFMGVANSILRGEADGGLSRLDGALTGALEQVRQTWTDVETIAVGYGAAL